MKHTIEGTPFPVARLQLEAGEIVISEAGGRTWAKGPVKTEVTTFGGAGKMLGRLFSGESLFMSRYTALGEAEIVFASSFPGQIVAKTLPPGKSIICQKSAFLCGVGNLELSVHFSKKIGAGLFGGEGFIMQKITGPGTVFLELDGHPVKYSLAAGEKLVCDTGVVAVMDETCGLDIQVVPGLKNLFFGGEGLFDTVVTGPGNVYVQSMTIAKLAGQINRFLPPK